MRSGAAAGHAGYFHETAFYGSDDDFLAIVVPFLEGGREADEPTLVALGDRNAALVRGALGDADGIEFVAGNYDRPASTIRAYQKRFAEHVRAGAAQIRVVGEVPNPGTGTAWDGWARYEAVVNHAYDAFPLWGMCPYDTRTTPQHVLDDVTRTHQHVATADGAHVANDRYEDPRSFLAARSAPPLDPIQLTRADLDLLDPSPADARAAVTSLPVELDAGTVADLVVAVSEIVTNATRHGRPPVRLRAWAAPDRMVVTVQDSGPGIADPFAGLVASDRDPATGGLGLWLAHQICSEVSVSRADDGCTVRLVAGTPFVDVPSA